MIKTDVFVVYCLPASNHCIASYYSSETLVVKQLSGIWTLWESADQTMVCYEFVVSLIVDY